jgi:hypothetical protein
MQKGREKKIAAYQERSVICHKQKTQFKIKRNIDPKPINPGLHSENVVHNGIKYHLLANP